MKRHEIDFTTTCQCAMCGRDKKRFKDITLSEHKLADYRTYTGCKILLCDTCSKIAGPGDVSVPEFLKSLKKRAKAVNASFTKILKDNEDALRFCHCDANVTACEPESFSLDRWIEAKENALLCWHNTADIFENYQSSWHDGDRNHCPVCGGKIKCVTDKNKLEIGDVIRWECENGCFWLDTEMAKRMYAYDVADAKVKRECSRWGYGYGQRRELTVDERFGDTLERRCVGRAMARIAELNKVYDGIGENAWRDVCHGLMDKNDGHCPNKRDCDSCAQKHCKDDVIKNALEELRRKTNSNRGWPVGSAIGKAMTPFDKLVSFKPPTARTGCAYFCAEPAYGNGFDLCGLTGKECAFCDTDCRECEKSKLGTPSNWMAKYTMCKHCGKGNKCSAEKGYSCTKHDDGTCRGVVKYLNGETELRHINEETGWPCGMFELKEGEGPGQAKDGQKNEETGK